MSSARFFTAVAIASLTFACTGGPGVPFPVPSEPRDPPGQSGTDSPGKSTDPAGKGPDPASGGPESPGGESSSSSGGSSSGGSSGSSSSGGGSGGGHCPSCDQDYDCSIPGVAGSNTPTTLQTTNGQCIVVGQNNAVFSCNGTITSGTTTVTWTSFGSGGFTFTSDGVTVQCVPADASTPMPVNGSTTGGK